MADNEGGAAVRGDTEQMLPKSKELSWWTPKRIEMPHIQGLRLVCMVWIIGYHYIHYAEGSELDVFINHRPLDFFTVISGFATHLAYGRRKSLGGAVAFVARRASKILFMYYLTLNLVFIAVLITMVAGSPVVTASEPAGGGGGSSTTYDFVKVGLSFVFSMLGLNVWVFPFAFFFTEENWQCWPYNGPLWYVQGLIFCWFTYPLLRDFMCGPSWTRRDTVILMVSLFIGGVVPIAFIIWAVGHPMLWLVVKVFPVFMLPAFYLGVAACDLYFQELQASEAEDQESQASARSWWTRWKRDWGGFIGELKLVLWFCLQLESYQGVFMSQTHSFALVFGSVLYCLGIAAALSDTHAYSLGLRWLLGCEWVVFFGDASFCAYTFQEPVAYIYWWAMRPGAFGTHLPQHWMSPWEFAVFLALLYALAIPFHLHVNTPVSDWIFEKLTAAFPGQDALFIRTPRSRPHTPVLPAMAFRGSAIPTLGTSTPRV